MNGDSSQRWTTRVPGAAPESGNALTIASHRRVVGTDYGVLHIDAGIGSTGASSASRRSRSTVHRQHGRLRHGAGHARFIEPGKRLDLPDLVLALMDAGEQVGVHLFDGYWLDIGRHEDYARRSALEHGSRSCRRARLRGWDACRVRSLSPAAPATSARSPSTSCSRRARGARARRAAARPGARRRGARGARRRAAQRRRARRGGARGRARGRRRRRAPGRDRRRPRVRRATPSSRTRSTSRAAGRRSRMRAPRASAASSSPRPAPTTAAWTIRPCRSTRTASSRRSRSTPSRRSASSSELLERPTAISCADLPALRDRLRRRAAACAST